MRPVLTTDSWNEKLTGDDLTLCVAGQLSDELGLPFVEARAGERIEGILRRSVDTLGGRYALIEQSHEFTLVPWRPALEKQLGQSVSGVMRSDGEGWTFGRGRNGPSV
jgi:hypothetical protein